MPDLTYLSLFSGIGGLDLGLDRAGWRCVGQVERDEFCRRVLTKHWPEVPKHDDVRTAVEWWRSGDRPPVRAVVGGFPCQPVSDAGKKLAQQDERWLWPEMADVIAAMRPEWVVGENVPGLRRRGLADVLRDLARLGYRARAGYISACEMGAPHPRKRLFILAHPESQGCRPGGARGRGPHASHGQLENIGGPRRRPGWPAEPRVGRVAYGIPAGVDRRRALGNAVVPQVGEHIGRLIAAADRETADA